MQKSRQESTLLFVILANSMGKHIFVFLSLLLFTSCSGDYGNKIIGGELSVFFVNAEDEQLAVDLAKYFKNRNLLSGQKQDVQLVREKDVHIVKVIAVDPKEAKSMPLNERKLLLELQKELQDSVFTENSVELVVCNEKFEPIYDLNQ